VSQETSIRPDLQQEALRLLDAIERRGVAAALIGGMAVRLLAGDQLPEAYRRNIADLDFVTRRADRRDLESVLVDAGYVADAEFNALNGARRMLFHDVEHGRQVDVFVDTFAMCHELPLGQSVAVGSGTLPAAEVLMTKLQIVELNAKDRGDLYALLAADLALEVERIAGMTANDWGLQHTFERNLDVLEAGLAAQPLAETEHLAVARRLRALREAMEQAPKTRKWKLRARIGERKRWYEEPEEVQRDA
jgi:Uncharacterised nucleotidyltransferase